MPYSIQLRMKSASEASYLIDCWSANDFMSAFYRANDVAKKLEPDHFVEIVKEESNEVVAHLP